ncbi:MAG: MFS transporter [Gammaproteobacteria bacterium]|nr:MFS transporter [Gammaproteobacteria bacterium]
MSIEGDGSEVPKSNIRRALEIPELRRIQLAWGISKIMFWGWVVTRSTVAFNEGGAWAVGLMLAVHMIPGALFTPLYAVLADRWGLIRGLALLAWLRAIAMAASAVILFADGPLIALIVICAFEGLGTHPGDTMHLRVLPWLARTPKELTASNSLTEVLRMNGMLVGPFCAVLLLLIAEPAVAFTVFAIGGFAAAFLFFSVENKIPRLEEKGVASVLTSLSEGCRTILWDFDIVVLVAFQAWMAICMASLQVIAAALALDVLDLGNSGPSMLGAAFGVGGLLGGVVSFKLSGRNDLVSPWTVGALLVGGGTAITGIYLSIFTAFAGMAISGVGLVFFMVAGTTLMQRGIPSHVQSSVFGFNFLIANTGFGLGGILCSSLIDLFDLNLAIMLIGGLMIFITPLAALSLRRFAVRANAHNDDIELLRISPIFKSLSIASLEQISRGLERIELMPNEGVYQQGETGEYFFIVSSGTLVTSADERFISTLEAGDFFGESALLHDIPLATTVAAQAYSEVFRLKKETFISMLADNPECKRAMLDLSAQRV